MKILLVRSLDRADINTRLPESLNRVRGILPPLGLGYIAAVLEGAGFDVKILDAPALGFAPSQVKQQISGFAADIVGVTAMTSTITGALETLRMAKEAGAVTVIGGAHLAVYPQETLSYDFIDYGIIGEGEFPFLNLARALDDKQPVKDIQGLVYKEGGQVRLNEPYIHLKLDEIPFPARHLLPMERYSSLISLNPVTTMISSRGCPFQCGFCFKTPSDVRYRTRSAKNIVDEMELLVKQYKVKEIMFYDDTLTLQKEHVVDICDEILSRDLRVKWESPTRIDNIDPPLLKAMRRAGCIRLRYGIESGDRGILKLMNKGIDLDHAREVFRWTKKSGIETFAYFIIGYLHETPQTIKNTIAFARELDPDLVMFTVAVAYPKTPLYELAMREGLVPGDYWREFTLGLRKDSIPYLFPQAEEWVRNAYRSFYFRPGYILKRLLKINSGYSLKQYFDAAKGILYFKMKPARSAMQ